MYRLVVFWGWLFQKFYPDRGWYVWAVNTISYGPYISRFKASLQRHKRSFGTTYVVVYLLKMPHNCQDTRKK
jgi:hypothetical protein